MFNECELELTYSTILFRVEDERLYKNICILFPIHDRKHREDGSQQSVTITVCGEGVNEEYLIFLNEYQVLQCVSIETALDCIVEICGEIICQSVKENIYIMHAASVMIRDELMLLAGNSGAGKTTLSLLLADYGHYLGDEYAYINANDGTLWHEQQPIKIKEGNNLILDNEAFRRIRGYNDKIGSVYYIPVLDIETHRKIDENDHVKLKYIVFPYHKRDLQETKITRIDYSELPFLILSSLFGKGQPSYVFRRFLHVMSEERIKLIRIEFSDGLDAAKKLKDIVLG